MAEMIKQEYAMEIRFPSDSDITSNDVREWLKKVLDGKVGMFEGFVVTTTPYQGVFITDKKSTVPAIVGSLIIQDTRKVSVETLQAFLDTNGEQFWLGEISKRISS